MGQEQRRARVPPSAQGLGTGLVAVALALLMTGAIFIGAAAAARRDQWAPLRRPLHLPIVAAGAQCPLSPVDPRVPWKRINIFGGLGIGRGPVYPGLPSGFLLATRDDQFGGPWYGSKVFWYVAPSYRGPVLIRGRQLDGRAQMGFNGRRAAAPELHIKRGQTVSWQGQPPASRGVPSSVRVLASGCYGFQIDGTTFSRVVVISVDIAS